MVLTAETFEDEICGGVASFDKFIVCIDKTPEECRASLVSLRKSHQDLRERGPILRHGIALDCQLTIILSQTEHERPLCASISTSIPLQEEAPRPKSQKRRLAGYPTVAAVCDRRQSALNRRKTETIARRAATKGI